MTPGPNSQAAQQYLRTKVLTATPEQLQLMLYDGALRFGEQAKVALDLRKWEESYTLISRVQKILMELICSLKHDVAPDLCKRLSGLYNFAYRRLIDANVRHDAAALDEAMGVLKYQRDTWALLLEQLGKTKAAAVAGRIDMPAPDPRMESKLSVAG